MAQRTQQLWRQESLRVAPELHPHPRSCAEAWVGQKAPGPKGGRGSYISGFQSGCLLELHGGFRMIGSWILSLTALPTFSGHLQAWGPASYKAKAASACLLGWVLGKSVVLPAGPGMSILRAPCGKGHPVSIYGTHEEKRENIHLGKTSQNPGGL